MGKPIGGTVYISVDGTQLELSSDDVTVNIDETDREDVAPGYFTEKDNIPTIECEAFVPKDFPMADIKKNLSMSITAELKSGKVAVLSEAHLSGKQEVSGGAGTMKLLFAGKSGKWTS